MTAPNASTALARVLVDELARHGLTDAVLAPGSRSAPLAIALHEHPRVRLHVEIDERSAAFLALGLGKATGRAAAVLCTSGSAAAHFHPAVLEADLGEVPLLLLTADRPPELRGTGANQTVDQLQLYGGAVRWFAEVGVPEPVPGSVRYWRSLASRAWHETGGGRPGPVHVNLAFREPLVPVPGGEPYPFALDGRAGGAPWTGRTPAAGGVEDDVLGRVIERYAPRRGVLVVGATRTETDPLLAFADLVGWPVLAEPHSGARRGAGAVPAYPLLLADEGFRTAHQPDLVLRVGRAGLSRGLLALLGSDAVHVLVDEAGAWHDPLRTLDDLILADPGRAAAAFLERAARGGGPARRDAVAGEPSWRERWLAAGAAALEAIDAVLDADDVPSEPRTARDLAAVLPDGSTLVAASSMPIRDLDQFLRPRAGLRVLANRGTSGIDGFVSTALGVALAGDGPTVALSGDLSLLHDQNGFLLADRPDLVVVVLNNDGGGIFSFLPQAQVAGFERVFGTPHGVDLARLAQVYELGYARLERAHDLGDLVESARARGGVSLIEVRTDRAANVALHRRVQAAVAAATG